MAEKASADRVAADMQPANYRAAAAIIRLTITKKKEKIAGINSEIGEQWAKVEGHKVNKKAGKIFAMLDKLEHEERVDIMRSLNGLMDASGWDQNEQDLVDAAQDPGNVVHMRFGGSTSPADDDKDMQELEQDLEEPAAVAEPAKPRRGRKPKETAADEGNAFVKAANKARGGGPTGETREQQNARASEAGAAAKARVEALAKGQPQPDPGAAPYTGDNSDLAGE